MPTIQQLAKEFTSRFEKEVRGYKSEYYRVKDGQETPDLLNLCREAHGDMLPDDWRYAFIVESLGILADCDRPDHADSLIEADIYTGELTEWLHSHTSRLGYCDSAVSKYGSAPEPFSTFDLLQWGQLAEKQEVFYSVLSSLHSLADEDEE
jgi:hypothetical protein